MPLKVGKLPREKKDIPGKARDVQVIFLFPISALDLPCYLLLIALATL